MKEFGTIGFEPTFTFNLNPTGFETVGKIIDDDLIWELLYNINDRIVDNIKQVIPRNHPWINGRRSKQYNDSSVIELASPIYSTFNKALKDYKSLVSVLETKNIISSGIYDLSEEGGCHINIGLEKRIEKAAAKLFKAYKESLTPQIVEEYIEQEKVDHRGNKYYIRVCNDEFEDRRTLDDFTDLIIDRFRDGLIQFLNNNPSIAWLCLSPYDAVSSKIPIHISRDTGKGYCFSWNDEGDIYVELRFFMMPRSIAEFEFHYKVANAILHHVFNEVITNINTNPKYSLENSFSAMLYSKAITQLKGLFPKLGLDWEEANKLGKFELLKERFSNKAWIK